MAEGTTESNDMEYLKRLEQIGDVTGTGTRIGTSPGSGASVDISGDREDRVVRATEPSAEMAGGGAGDPAPGIRGDETGSAYGLDDRPETPYGAAGTGTDAGEERLGRGPDGEPGADSGNRAAGSIGSTDLQEADL